MCYHYWILYYDGDQLIYLECMYCHERCNDLRIVPAQ